MKVRLSLLLVCFASACRLNPECFGSDECPSGQVCRSGSCTAAGSADAAAADASGVDAALADAAGADAGDAAAAADAAGADAGPSPDTGPRDLGVDEAGCPTPSGEFGYPLEDEQAEFGDRLLFHFDEDLLAQQSA